MLSPTARPSGRVRLSAARFFAGGAKQRTSGSKQTSTNAGQKGSMAG